MLKLIPITDDPQKINADILGLFCFEGKIEKGTELESIDKALSGLISETLKNEKYKGSVGEIKVLHTHHKIKSRYVAVIGLGEIKKCSHEVLRRAAGKFAQVCHQLKGRKAALVIHEVIKDLVPVEEALQVVAEGLTLSTYKFTQYFSKKEPHDLAEVFVAVPSKTHVAPSQKALERGAVFAEATNYARDLVNQPPGELPPEALAHEAKKLKGVKVRVWNAQSLKRMGMGALAGVGQGARNAPVFIEMIYQPKSAPKKTIALVGKGVTFDSGGLSLKPAKSMETMKDDMSGAAALFGVMKILPFLNPSVEVRAYVPAAENMPGGNAIRPGDVLKALNGKTIEVLNTDAEGRLILADALSYAVQQKPDVIVDLATLTGACVVAVGELYSAVMTNTPSLAQELIEAGKKAGENIWELPLVEDYKEEMKSQIADLQNIGGGHAGTIFGGLFLQEFIEKVSWAHIDIAGPSWANKPQAYIPKGGTGVMVRTLVQWIAGF